jgi:hypothetical protein
MGKGSSAPPQPQNQTVTQTNLPEYARPYFENLLERSQAESYRDYTPYEGQRLEGFTPQQEAIRAEAMGMTTPGQFAPASNIAQQAAMQSLGTQYDPTRFNYMGVQAPSLNQYQMGPFERVQGQQFGAPQMGTATTGFQPTLDQFQIQAPAWPSKRVYRTSDGVGSDWVCAEPSRRADSGSGAISSTYNGGRTDWV